MSLVIYQHMAYFTVITKNGKHKRKKEKEQRELLGKDINKAKLQSVINEIKGRNEIIRSRLKNTNKESDVYADKEIVELIEDYDTLSRYLTEVTS